MSTAEIARALSRYLFIFAALLLLPLSVSFIYEEMPSSKTSLSFLYSLLITLFIAFLFYYKSRGSKGILQRRESIVTVALIWGLSSSLAALPFWFSGTLSSPLDALFESVSNLTTTGSTVFEAKAYSEGVEIPLNFQGKSYYGTITPLKAEDSGIVTHEGLAAVSRALLFWRCFLQWLGGMGIIVLFLTILPALAMGGRFLFEAEATGVSKEGLTPRIRESASMLWKIYVGLTLLEMLLLKLVNPALSLFDITTLSFSTLSTGGSPTHMEYIRFYNHIGTECVLTFFMILGSINFTLYFYCLKGKIFRLFEREFFVFFLTLIVGSLLMTLLLFFLPGAQGKAYSFSEALRYGIFQAISSQTSTGFISADYDLWPYAAQCLIVLLTFIGGMSGSTSGGIKIARHYVLFKAIGAKIKTLFRPETITTIQIGKKLIPEKMIMSVLIYLCILFGILMASSFIYIIDGIDPYTSFGLSSALLNNSGLSFTLVGPTSSCAFLSPFSKAISIFLMLLGRLEFFVLLVLFVPSFWRNR